MAKKQRDEDREKDRQQRKKSFMADAITSEAAKIARGLLDKPNKIDSLPPEAIVPQQQVLEKSPPHEAQDEMIISPQRQVLEKSPPHEARDEMIISPQRQVLENSPPHEAQDEMIISPQRQVLENSPPHEAQDEMVISPQKQVLENNPPHEAQGVAGKPVRFDRVTKIDPAIYKKWVLPDEPSTFRMRNRGTKKDARLKASLSRVRKMCKANFSKNIFKGIYGGPAIKLGKTVARKKAIKLDKITQVLDADFQLHLRERNPPQSPAKAGTSAGPARDEAAGSARDEAASSVEHVEFPEMDFHDRDEAAGSARDEAASSVQHVEFPEMDFHDRDEVAGSAQDVEFRGRDVGEEAVSDAAARQAVIDWLANNLNISLEPVIRSTIENLLSSLLTHGVESSNEPTIRVADFLRGLRKECAAKIFYILLVLINEGYLDVEEDDIQQEPLFERAVFKRGRKM